MKTWVDGTKDIIDHYGHYTNIGMLLIDIRCSVYWGFHTIRGGVHIR
jgi:hypothetical protein